MKTVVVTSFDEKIFFKAAVMVRMLCDNYYGSDTLEFRCLVPDTLLTREQEFINIIGNPILVNIKFACSERYPQMVKDGVTYDSKSHITANSSHRIFIASMFPDFDKAIYIDYDTVVLRDIQPMLDYPLKNKLLAVDEQLQSAYWVFGEMDRPYFNAGVFITDLNFWREHDAENKMYDWLMNNKTPNMDQDTMNIIFFDYWAPMPMTFNMFEFRYSIPRDQTGLSFKEPLIVHFTGEAKPWATSGKSSKYSQIWMDKYKEIYGKEAI